MGKLYLISGDDDFVRKQSVRNLIMQLSGFPVDEEHELEENPELEVVVGDTPDIKVSEIAGSFLESLMTPPFLTPGKLIWLKHFPDFDFFNGKDPIVAEIIDVLCNNLPENITVVIDGPNLDQRKAYVKQFNAINADIQIFNTTKATDKNAGENRRRLIGEFFEKNQKKISPEALNYLQEVLSGDAGLITNELEKLSCFVGNNPVITINDCEAIVSRTTETVSWDFTNAVVEGNVGKALLNLGALLEPGDMELRVLSLLSNEYQKMIQTHMAMNELGLKKVTSQTFSSLAPDVKEKYPDNPLLKLHPYRAFKVCESAMQINGVVLADKLSAIRNTYRELVSSASDKRIVLEQLVIKLSSKTR